MGKGKTEVLFKLDSTCNMNRMFHPGRDGQDVRVFEMPRSDVAGVVSCVLTRWGLRMGMHDARCVGTRRFSFGCNDF